MRSDSASDTSGMSTARRTMAALAGMNVNVNADGMQGQQQLQQQTQKGVRHRFSRVFSRTLLLAGAGEVPVCHLTLFPWAWLVNDGGPKNDRWMGMVTDAPGDLNLLGS
ncbi:hypothetical protein B0H13DRAFT_2681659 [Mycena leptocephala]|nr:hypothetical protein B0H13DRAFT_2681659 [Mycena leptocephala]